MGRGGGCKSVGLNCANSFLYCSVNLALKTKLSKTKLNLTRHHEVFFFFLSRLTSGTFRSAVQGVPHTVG